MLAYIEGEIKHKGESYVVVLANGVGYKVFVGAPVWVDLAMGATAKFFLYHHVREDQSALFGFKGADELAMFELLLTISGIGPKSALAVLSVGQVDEIKESIAMGDPSLLTKVSGIGKKTAERVVLELRDKIGAYKSGPAGPGLKASSDEIDALVALGYNVIQAREALKAVDPDIQDSGERIRSALRSLGR